MEAGYSLISCICITYNRIVLLKRAIECFKSQDYPNKELIISYPENDQLTKYTIDELVTDKTLKIIILERAKEVSLGTARNQAITIANGDYICIWDDDDWYHTNRLSYQLRCIQSSENNYKASILSRLLFYDSINQKAYLSFYYTWEGTLMCKKTIFTDNQYSNKNIGEDSNIIDFLDATQSLYHISDVPFLYIYIFHNDNTWDHDHFNSFFERSELLGEDLAQYILRLTETSI